MIGSLGEVENAPFSRDRSDESFAHPEARHVHGFLAQAVGGEQLEEIVAQQID